MKLGAWNELAAALEAPDVSACVEAASRLNAEASAEDVPRLLNLLEHNSFFVREAAAWPLAELVGPTVLRELFVAYQRGFDEGHDNDGFTAALLEIPALHPMQAPQALQKYISAASGALREHAQWLLEFCERGAPQIENGA